MIIFPAIDLKDGRCVRLKRGEMDSATVFNDDPAAQAKKFADAGFRWLHCVDLNGAFEGRSVNASAVAAIRDAIDRYKDTADKGGFQIKADSMGYPPDLETLVNGVEVQGKKVRFLRKIPVDPMTGNAEWGLRSNQDDADSDSFGGQNVFDVHSKSTGTALDGTRYAPW